MFFGNGFGKIVWKCSECQNRTIENGSGQSWTATKNLIKKHLFVLEPATGDNEGGLKTTFLFNLKAADQRFFFVNRGKTSHVDKRSQNVNSVNTMSTNSVDTKNPAMARLWTLCQQCQQRIYKTYNIGIKVYIGYIWVLRIWINSDNMAV